MPSELDCSGGIFIAPRLVYLRHSRIYSHSQTQTRSRYHVHAMIDLVELKSPHAENPHVSKISVIIAAAGNSTRFGASEKKTFTMLAGTPVWVHSARVFASHQQVQQIIVAISPDDESYFVERFESEIKRFDAKVVLGGAQRSDSVANALAAVDSDSDLIAIHDGARPCIDLALFQGVIDAAETHGAAIPAVPVNSTIKRSDNDQLVTETVDRSDLHLAQTPQVFDTKIIRDAYERRGSLQPTDEAQLLETLGIPVAIAPGSPFNIKITQPEDLRFAEACLAAIKPIQFDAGTDGDPLLR